MAWSTKIVIGDGGTAGANEFEIVYDAASQTEYAKQYGGRLRENLPNIVYHSPDNEEPTPSKATPKLAEYYCTFNIENAADYDEVANLLAPLKRAVHGPKCTAIKHNMKGGGYPPVYLRITPDGASNYSQFKVVVGIVDAGAAMYKPESVRNTAVNKAVISLVVYSEGRGATQYASNSLPSSPHMLVDGNGDGLADGLTLIGTPAKQISTEFHLIGGQSQYISQGSAASEGFDTDSVTLSNGHWVIGYAWIYPQIDTVRVYLRNITDGTDVGTKTISPTDQSDADKSVKGPDGATWYRISYVYQNATGVSKDYALRIYAPSTGVGTTWNTDGLYLQDFGPSLAAPPIPDVWTSAKGIRNRHDPTTSNPEYINYLDVWGIPGDQPARSIINIQPVMNTDRIMLSSWHDGERYAHQFKHIIDSDELTLLAASTVVSASRHGGSYIEATAAGGSGDQKYDFSLNTADHRPFFDYDSRVFLVVKVDNAAGADFNIESGLPSFNTTIDETAVNVVSTLSWELIDVSGYVNIPLNEYVQSPGSGDWIGFNADAAGGAKWQFDFMYLFPADNFIAAELPSATINKTIVIDGIREQAFIAEDAQALDIVGGSFTLQPGVMNRLLLVGTNAGVHTITDVYNMWVVVEPRSSHLMGNV